VTDKFEAPTSNGNLYKAAEAFFNVMCIRWPGAVEQIEEVAGPLREALKYKPVETPQPASKLSTLLERARDSIREYANDAGDDHSVGLCNCALHGLADELEAAARQPFETLDEYSYATKQELFNAGTTQAKYRIHYQKALSKIAKLKVTGPSPLGALHGAGMASGFEIAAKIAEEAFDVNPECSPEEPKDLRWALDRGDELADWINRARPVITELMAAYERRIRTDCTPEDLANQPWRCMEYIGAEELLKDQPKAVVEIRRPVETKDRHSAPCTCPACAPALWAAGIKGVRQPEKASENLKCVLAGCSNDVDPRSAYLCTKHGSENGKGEL